MSNKQQKKQQKNSDAPGKPFTKDDPRINREGRPKGSKNFSTLFEEAAEKVAEEKNMNKSEVQKEMLAVGIRKSMDGEFNFYKYLHNKLYGKPTQHTDVTSKGKEVQQLVVPSELTEKYNTTDETTEEDS